MKKISTKYPGVSKTVGINNFGDKRAGNVGNMISNSNSNMDNILFFYLFFISLLIYFNYT